jgi:hypothetical protein
MPVLSQWDLTLTPQDVLRAQGADPELVRKRRPVLWEIASWAANEGMPLLTPQVLYQELTVKSMTHERLELTSGLSPSDERLIISGPLVSEHLLGASAVVAMLCTVGDALEETASLLMEEDPMRGWALDSAGSAAAELLATHASHHFENLAQAKGWQSSMPLNPGMVGWPVPQGQTQLFKLLETEQEKQQDFNVTLNENYLMQPRKTVSLVLGVGAEMNPQGRICDYCTMSETCRYQNHYR